VVVADGMVAREVFSPTQRISLLIPCDRAGEGRRPMGSHGFPVVGDPHRGAMCCERRVRAARPVYFAPITGCDEVME
jgi:hypothetical protein